MKKGKKRSFKEKKVQKLSKIKWILLFLIRIILLPFFLLYELLKKLLIKIPIILLDKLKVLLHKLKLFVFKKPIKPQKEKKHQVVKYYDDGDLKGCHKCHNGFNDQRICSHKKKKFKQKQLLYKVDSSKGSKLEMILNKIEAFIKKVIFKIKQLVSFILRKIKSVIKEIILILRYIKTKILVTLSKLSYYFNKKLNKSIDNKESYKIPMKPKFKKPRIFSDNNNQDEFSYSSSISEDQIVQHQTHKPITSQNDDLPTFEIVKTVTYNDKPKRLLPPPPVPYSSRPKQFSVNCTNSEIIAESTAIDDYFENFDAIEAT